MTKLAASPHNSKSHSRGQKYPRVGLALHPPEGAREGCPYRAGAILIEKRLRISKVAEERGTILIICTPEKYVLIHAPLEEKPAYLYTGQRTIRQTSRAAALHF
jgi:hypothetical protein